MLETGSQLSIQGSFWRPVGRACEKVVGQGDSSPLNRVLDGQQGWLPGTLRAFCPSKRSFLPLAGTGAMCLKRLRRVGIRSPPRSGYARSRRHRTSFFQRLPEAYHAGRDSRDMLCSPFSCDGIHRMSSVKLHFTTLIPPSQPGTSMCQVAGRARSLEHIVFQI